MRVNGKKNGVVNGQQAKSPWRRSILQLSEASAAQGRSVFHRDFVTFRANSKSAKFRRRM